MPALTKWLDQLVTEMTRIGIDPLEQRRLVAELRDHWEDCQLESADHSSQRSAQMATDQMGNSLIDQLSARMGSADTVARAAKEQGPRNSFTKRHPLLVCLVAPIPMMLILAATYAAIVLAVLAVWKPEPSSAAAPYILPALFLGFLYIPSMAAALLLTWVTMRNAIKKRWLVLGMIPLTLLASHLTLIYRLPEKPGDGNLSLGANLSPSLGNIPQLIAPLAAAAAIGLWLHLRTARNPRADGV